MGEGENSTARWLTVNGQRREVVAADDTPLLYVLRNHLDLKGTRFGCGLAQCGSCSVLVNGVPQLSRGRMLSIRPPPDLNWLAWRFKPQHVMTIIGDHASANLLIVPYATHSALALMVLRRAAGLPINPADREKPAFQTAGSILLAAQQQCVATKTDPTRNMLG